MNIEARFTVSFEKDYRDTILNVDQISTAEFRQHNVKQDDLPQMINELNGKGYRLTAIYRPRIKDESKMDLEEPILRRNEG